MSSPFIRPQGFQLDPNERTVEPTLDFPVEVDTENREIVEDEEFEYNQPVGVVLLDVPPRPRVKWQATRYAFDGTTVEPVMVLSNDGKRVRAVLTANTGTPTLLTRKTEVPAFGFAMVAGQTLELTHSEAVYAYADVAAELSVISEYVEE